MQDKEIRERFDMLSARCEAVSKLLAANQNKDRRTTGEHLREAYKQLGIQMGQLRTLSLAVHAMLYLIPAALPQAAKIRDCVSELVGAEIKEFQEHYIAGLWSELERLLSGDDVFDAQGAPSKDSQGTPSR